MLNQKQKLGKLGENLAREKLLKSGYQYISQNFRSKFGEIDLIFQDKNTLVAVEVKTRVGLEFGLPEEAVNRWQTRSIIKTGQYFQLLHSKLPQELRIDVVAILFEEETEKLVYIKHYKNITL